MNTMYNIVSLHIDRVLELKPRASLAMLGIYERSDPKMSDIFLTWFLWMMAQVYGNPLWQGLRLDDDLPLARGVPGVSGPDKAQLRVADLLLLVLVRLPAPAALQGAY